MSSRPPSFYRRFIKFLLTEPDTFIHTCKTLKKASREHKQSFGKTVREAHRLLYQYGFSPQEAYPLGLLDLLNRHEDVPFLSKAIIEARQQQINPPGWNILLKDKSLFYRHCQALNLPIPQIYAYFFSNEAGWCNTNDALLTKDDWIDFFNTRLPQRFIVKPSMGSHGEGVKRYQNLGGGFCDHKSEYIDSETLYHRLKSDPGYQSFVIQEVMTNHTRIKELSGTDALQTLRITTLLDDNKHFRILHACFKTIVGTGIVDNHHSEGCRNLLSDVCLDTGALIRTITTFEKNGLRSDIKCHPVTGHSLTNFPLPMWTEACELALQAARSFQPLRTAGWDIALSEDKPVLIEGNQNWEPPNLSR
ncbi:sugar-transfer associated ATP-grasp domain-containing protein [Legionella spiritensis]|uniref:sugar-transfer associated ATP-grasp domain-containing protein n=1 Tax=Legionella spiritensis TaxID=452 RepID=UPI000F6B5F58|nr:sugar-transfer associated ATP-grasp domain-containing protein [Legionella spiritensis]VEG89781.1 Uncharacterised protein [Legionella spiritensis]